MSLADQISALLSRLSSIETRLTSLRGTGGGGGVTAHHATHEPGGADAITTPPVHHTRHESGGADPVKLDDLGAPDDNTDLNASAAKHGLLPKLSNVSTEFLNGQGAFSTPSVAPAAHHLTHESGGADAIKLDDLAAPDDNTDLNVSTSKHGLAPKAPNDTTKFLRGDGTWQPVTSGGANTVKLWSPDVFPTSPAAQCDHFDDSSIDAKWTAFQSHAALTVTEGDTFLKLVDTGNGAATHNLRGYFQALPAGDCVIACRLGFIPDMSNEQGAFLALFDDATGNPNTTSILTLGLYCVGSTPYILVSSWGNYTTFGSNPYSYTGGWVFMPYLRFRRSGTTWFADHSMDGLNWYRNWTNTEAGLGWTPSEMGILVDNRTAANTLTLWVDWFYYSGSHSISPPGSTSSFWIT